MEMEPFTVVFWLYINGKPLHSPMPSLEACKAIAEKAERWHQPGTTVECIPHNVSGAAPFKPVRKRQE
jgi:hypothetical protein